jgi:4-amino-4-deoxy-L-arabinose transferase-like glycosyltransferase
MKNYLKLLLFVLIIALIARALLLSTNAISFHSDEAIVGLMARHISQGERPVFFYGQAYMGSLDAWLVALGFQIFGESVQTIRLIQSVLYLLIVTTGTLVAWRFSGKTMITLVTGLLFALPSSLFALYTTASLGGYSEVLLLGNLVLLLGYEVAQDLSATQNRPTWWKWLLLGLCVGIGWWVNGLIVVYALPVSLPLLYRLMRGAVSPVRNRLLYIVIAAVAFFVGSAPWWVYNLEHQWAALAFYVPSLRTETTTHVQYLTGLYTEPVEFQEAANTSIGERVIGLLLFGLPALTGLRFSWSSAFFLPVIGLFVTFLFLASLYTLARDTQHKLLTANGRSLTLGMVIGLLVIFILSQFGKDPTGRYLLPLALPFSIAFAALIERINFAEPLSLFVSRGLQGALVLIVVGYHAAGQITAATTSPGLTTQFDPVSHVSNDDDEALITFLEEHQLTRGYTHYWVAYRLAFLSDEQLLFVPMLPYKPTLIHFLGEDRYPLYSGAVGESPTFAFINANSPELDALLVETFEIEGIDFQQEQIGFYTIYYGFDAPPPRPLSR